MSTLRSKWMVANGAFFMSLTILARGPAFTNGKWGDLLNPSSSTISLPYTFPLKAHASTTSKQFEVGKDEYCKSNQTEDRVPSDSAGGF